MSSSRKNHRLTAARASGLTIITAPKVKDRASTAQATPRRARAQGGLACAVLALPFAVSTPLPVLGDAALIAVAGVAVNGFGYTLYARGARQVASLTAVMLCLAEPLLNPVWVFLFLGEAPTPAGAVSLLLILAGGFLDVAGAWLRSLQTRRNARL